MLIPLSWIYQLAISIRNRLFNLKIIPSREFHLPTISVGNITVGGTGKTPHTEYLVELLTERYRVATLSRGYKRKTKGFRIAQNNSTVAEVGDEPLQIKKKYPNITVAVSEKRVEGVEQLLKLEGDQLPEVVLLDDAFQHRYITPGINILLTDYNRLITRDHLLPWGRLREPAQNHLRAQIIIVTKCPKTLKPIDERIITNELGLQPFQNLFFTTLDYGTFQPVFPEDAATWKDQSQNAPTFMLVTGIANPKPLKEELKTRTPNVKELTFPDHHAFTTKDMLEIGKQFRLIENTEKYIITTEKDMIRFRGMHDVPDEVRAHMFFLPLKIKFLNNEGKNFDRKILNYVRENKSNFDLHFRNHRL